ncbi:SMP-30/gluconolactonase/LRE family protein [Adhaeribacter radiodurans]|uniref:ATP/GTP-binding protein n=1 Tax=Adhaeribacter radiodurans TaxID=2745197 RepID=A0A7L7LCI3_9BACT|nr:ATP/GTP-binding protein [Adhaeribacter radiodurans]QMU30404.1 ATP/GTP-binding protein [Adhaeribacter radiodurans]
MNKNRFAKSCLLGALLLGFTQISSPAVAQTVSLVKKWETPATLKEPESVLYDKANKVLYASNINNPAGNADGNGSIARISLNGDIQKVEWVVGGMDSPKGLGLSKGLLYVADLTKVVVIDTKTAKVVRTIPVADAGMLNDITVDAQGVVYVSDSDKKRVYRLQNNQAEVWLEKDHFQKPNGLLAHQNKFYMIDMTAGIFYEVNKTTKELRKIAEGLQGGDGIIPYGKDFIISNWNGEINYVTASGQVTKLLDTKAEKVNAADIEYIPEQNLLLVPTFFANKVVAYQVKK